MFTYPEAIRCHRGWGWTRRYRSSVGRGENGCQTLLLTLNLDTIGQMSCNPAIGGLGKGHLVREIDALGGEMGKTTDLEWDSIPNAEYKEGTVWCWSPRAQCDKKAYQFRMKEVCEGQTNLIVNKHSPPPFCY